MLVGGPGCPECRSRSLIFATGAPVSLHGRTCPKAPSVLKSRGGVVPADLLRLRIPDARLSGGPARGGAESCGPSRPVRRARSTGRRRCRLVEVGTGSLLASGVRRMQRGRYGETSVCPCLNAAAAFSHSAIALPLASDGLVQIGELLDRLGIEGGHLGLGRLDQLLHLPDVLDPLALTAPQARFERRCRLKHRPGGAVGGVGLAIGARDRGRVDVMIRQSTSHRIRALRYLYGHDGTRGARMNPDSVADDVILLATALAGEEPFVPGRLGGQNRDFLDRLGGRSWVRGQSYDFLDRFWLL